MSSREDDTEASRSDSSFYQVDELKALLQQEKRRSAQLKQEVDRLKAAQVEMQAAVEQEEEFLTNKLMKKLQMLQEEKEQLVREVDREEEFLTNTLQKKLDELRKEKVELETRLEIEQEYIVNKLRKQIASVTNEKNELESKLALNSSELIEKLFDSVQRLQSNEVADSAPAMFAELSAQIKALHEAQVQYRRDHQACEKANRELKEQLKRNENENFVLGQKVLQQQERAKQLSQQNASLQADWEIQQERQVNAAGRCLRNSSLSSSSSSAAAARPICGVPALARDLSTRSLTSSSSSPRTADLRTGPLSGRQQATKATEATEETEEENQQEQPQK